MVVFDHELTHAGTLVVSGLKINMRTDIMYGVPPAEAPDRCWRNHKMAKTKAKIPGSCDACKREVAKREMVMECEPCNWWVCDRCYSPKGGDTSAEIKNRQVHADARSGAIKTARRPVRGRLQHGGRV